MYAAYHDVDEGAATALLLGLLGGTEDEPPVIDDTPRIVLVAGDFRPEMTTTVLWLVDKFENMDIRCVRLQPFEIARRIIVSSEVIIPLPEAEQYRLSVQRKRREVIETQAAKAKAGRLVPRLLEAGALAIGDTLYFRQTAVPDQTIPPSLPVAADRYARQGPSDGCSRRRARQTAHHRGHFRRLCDCLRGNAIARTGRAGRVLCRAKRSQVSDRGAGLGGAYAKARHGGGC